jgi:hypothetical protein
MKPFYSVEAMVSTEGKNYKGTLDFYNTKCVLHNPTRTIEEFEYELNTAEFESGITTVLFLGLYTKEKSYIQIQTNTKQSPMFIIDDDKIEVTLQAVKNQKEQKSNTQLRSAQKATTPEQKRPQETTKKVEGFNETAVSRFTNNPYSVLGIPSNSSFSDANDALAKIKKLDRLKAIGSYKTDFKLAGFDDVVRDLPMCQNAMALIKELKYKWFWFDSVEACQNWQFEWYREPFVSSNPDTWSYDVFLAQYLSLLCFDSGMSRRQDWYDIFAFYQYVAGENHVEFLRTKLNKEENAKYSDKELIDDFAEHIFAPLNDVIESAGINAMLSFFRSLRMDRFSAMKEYKRNLGGIIAQWFINQEKTIWEKIESLIGTGELNSSSTNIVREAVKVYDDAVQPVLGNTLAALTKEPLRSEMVKSSYGKVMRQVMILLLAGNCKAEACKYANYYYKYADKDFKLKMISTFGAESIAGAADELPELMKQLPQPKADKPMVTENQFEDITICEATSLLPRIDFCGLTFNGRTIGIKFWLLNRTGIELKFWLMDININGIYCGSTEIIATVEDGENDFYTYELSLPDGVRYSSVEKIDFYVEVDQPGNSTIHDTDVVKVTCNTSKRIFSAKY